MKKLIIILSIILLCYEHALSSKFDDLDKAPEGAHYGQVLIGTFVSIGNPIGDVIKAEKSFLKGSTYTFLESSIIKEFPVSHLSFNMGFSFEYMPIDHVGIKSKIKRSVIIQRTVFGTDYKNWTQTLFTDYSFFLGPAFHLTNRKQWDFTLTPLIGYSILEFSATPVAAHLMRIDGYYGSRIRGANNFVFDLEFNFTAYFSGGLYFSIGFDWNLYMLQLGNGFFLQNPQTSIYYPMKSSSKMHILSFIFSIGYAFSN